MAVGGKFAEFSRVHFGHILSGAGSGSAPSSPADRDAVAIFIFIGGGSCSAVRWPGAGASYAG